MPINERVRAYKTNLFGLMYEDTLSPRLELHRLSYGALELGDLEAAAAVTGIPAFGFKYHERRCDHAPRRCRPHHGSGLHMTARQWT